MIKRTTEQWLALFEAHKQSGLNQAQFCKEQGLCSKHFGLRKRQLLGSEQQKPFVRVRRTQASVSMSSPMDWQLQIGEIQLRVLNASVEQMVNLIKNLA